jgi:steroid 5-alpha reductase family enzyme
MDYAFSTGLFVEAVLVLVYMTLAFFIARIRNRLDTVDVAWGLGFVLIAWSIFLQKPNDHSLLLASLISIWGLRLSRHIYRRSKTKDDDRRYRELSRKWQGNFWLRAYCSIFLLQGLLVLIISLPIIVSANRSLHSFWWLSIFGGAIWLAGFVFEAIADHQLAVFLMQKNRPQVLQTGLWRYSRHPNYFGELTQWWGIALIALNVSYGWIGLLSPILLTVLIMFVSGIPPIERHRSKDPSYQLYQKQTSVLIPLPPHEGAQG